MMTSDWPTRKWEGGWKPPTTIEEWDAFMGVCYCGLPWSHPDHDGPSVGGPISVRLRYEGIERDIPMEEDDVAPDQD